MFHFEYPYLLFLLILLPFLMAYERKYRQRQINYLETLGGWQSLKYLMPGLKEGYKVGQFKFWATILALACLIIALANPRKGMRTQAMEVDGADVYIAIDVSESMWAQDVVPSRIARARQLANKLIDQLQGNRFGLVFFAGQSFLQMPLSSDSEAAKLLIQGASPDFNIEQGTSIESVVELLLKVGSQRKDNSNKIVLFLTDGENHSDAAIEKISEGLDAGLISYVLGIGTVQGAAIPLPIEGAPKYKEDINGQKIISKMNMPILKELAKAGGGEFYDASQHNDALINALQKAIQTNQKTILTSRSYDSYESYFHYFIGLALLLLSYTFVKTIK